MIKYFAKRYAINITESDFNGKGGQRRICRSNNRYFFGSAKKNKLYYKDIYVKISQRKTVRIQIDFIIINRVIN